MSSPSSPSSPSSKPGDSAGARPGAAPKLQAAHKPQAHQPGDAEEIFEVVRSRSRFQIFVLLLLLVILVIFSVTGSIYGACGQGRGPSGAYLSWQHPTRGTMEISASDYIRFKRSLSEMAQQTPDDQLVASLLVLDELAREAGVEATDAELEEQIKAFALQLGGKQQYLARMRGFTGGVRGFESTLRVQLRVERYTTLLAHLADLPEPSRIEDLWAEQHVERAYEYAQLALADFEQAARAELPADAELEAWYGGLDEAQRAPFRSPERTRAELIGLKLGGEIAADALLAAYPAPEGADAEARAKEYYDQNYFRRFARPQPLDAGSETPGQDFARNFYFSYEEVAETARAEAPAWHALNAWLTEVLKRQEAGETIDLAAEAARLGLAYEPGESARTFDEWNALPDWSGQMITSSLRGAPLGQLMSTLLVSEKSFTVLRLSERLSPTMPLFADVRDQVAEAWIKQRRAPLALARLAAVRAALLSAEQPTSAPAEESAAADIVSAETFAAALTEAGLELHRRDWLDQSAPLSADPNASLPAHVFLRQRFDLNELPEGSVPEPATDRADTHAYLVRCAGSRPIDFSAMTPEQYQGLKVQAGYVRKLELQQRLFSPQAVRELYRVRFAGEEEQPGPEPTPAAG